jgi:hypothetical protein
MDGWMSRRYDALYEGLANGSVIGMRPETW